MGYLMQKFNSFINLIIILTIFDYDNHLFAQLHDIKIFLILVSIQNILLH